MRKDRIAKMKRESGAGTFFMMLAFNFLMRFYLTIPGWILLILHFIIPQYIKWWYSVIWFGAYVLYILIWMLVLTLLGRWVSTAEPTPPVVNKNPYSATEYTPTAVNKNPYSVKEYKSLDKRTDD